MAIQVQTQPYDPQKVELLKKHLMVQAQKGQPRYFEIYVDTLKAVPRTNDVDDFDSFEDYVTEDTLKIKILLYTTSATSPRNERHVFTLKQSQQDPSLNGVDIDTRINERVSAERKRWEAEQVTKELEDTRQKLSDAEDYIDQLHRELDVLQEKAKSSGWGELTSGVIGSLIKNNPQLIEKTGLSGLIGSNTEDQTEPAEPTATASFKKKGASVDATEDDQRYIAVIRQMEEHFDPDQLAKVMQIVQQLADDTSQIDPVAELLTN